MLSKLEYSKCGARSHRGRPRPGGAGDLLSAIAVCRRACSGVRSGHNLSEAVDKVQALISAIKRWCGLLPGGVVEVNEQLVSEGDEYGTQAKFVFHPRNQRACSMEIGVTGAAAGAGVYIFLDRWSRIASRENVAVRPGTAGLVGLYTEPTPLSMEEVIGICSAVAEGAVHLEIGLRSGVLIATSGYVMLQQGPLAMRGVGVPFFVLRLLGLVRLGETRVVRYSSWSA